MPIEADPMLRRLQRNAIVACLAMAAAAYVLGHGRWAPVLGVFGGGLLVRDQLSYDRLRSQRRRRRPDGEAAAGRRGGPAPPKVGRTAMVIVIGRYFTRSSGVEL